MEIANLTRLLAHEPEIEVTVACLTVRQEGIRLDNRVKYFQFQNPIFPRLSWFMAINDLKNLIDQHDILFSTGIWGPIDGFALRLAWQQDKPVYIRICGMLEPYILARNSWKKSLGKLLYLRKNLRRATGIIVNSWSESLSAKNAGVEEEKILVIPNGVHIKKAVVDKEKVKASFGLDPNYRVLLYLGRLHPKKGFHMLLEAIAQLSKEERKLNLLVAGEFSDESYRSQIHELVQDLELKPFVKFSGLVTGTEKERHFNAADCFILPSQSEGLPNAVLEAMAHGLPAIVTSGCNIPEIAEYEAGKVLDFSVPQLLEAIHWFLSETTSLQSSSEGALRLIKERFSLEDSVNQYKQIIFSHSYASEPRFSKEVVS